MTNVIKFKRPKGERNIDGMKVFMIGFSIGLIISAFIFSFVNFLTRI